MLRELKRAFSAYSSKPFLFMWGSVLYVFFILLFFLSALGIAMLVLIASFLFDYPLELESPVVIETAVILSLYFLFFTGGITSAVVRTYKSAMTGTKTSLLDFYQYALTHSPMMGGITLLRELFCVLLIAPAVAVYYFYLMEYEYMDLITILYAFLVIFFLRFIFKPAVVSSGLGELPFDAFKRVYFIMKTKHIYFLGLFILLSIVWLLNFIPIIQFVTLFFFYPIVYSALIEMVSGAR